MDMLLGKTKPKTEETLTDDDVVKSKAVHESGINYTIKNIRLHRSTGNGYYVYNTIREYPHSGPYSLNMNKKSHAVFSLTPIPELEILLDPKKLKKELKKNKNSFTTHEVTNIGVGVLSGGAYTTALGFDAMAGNLTGFNIMMGGFILLMGFDLVKNKAFKPRQSRTSLKIGLVNLAEPDLDLSVPFLRGAGFRNDMRLFLDETNNPYSKKTSDEGRKYMRQADNLQRQWLKEKDVDKPKTTSMVYDACVRLSLLYEGERFLKEALTSTDDQETIDVATKSLVSNTARIEEEFDLLESFKNDEKTGDQAKLFSKVLNYGSGL